MLLNLIQNAIHDLITHGVTERDLQITYSPLVERQIMDEFQEKYHFNYHHNIDRIYNVEINNKHFKNEIVVHYKLACYRPELVRIITL